MTRELYRIALLTLALTIGGCGNSTGPGSDSADGDAGGSGDCTVGTEGCPCTGGGACDPGLMCLSGLCVASNGSDGTGDGGTGSGAPGDSSSGDTGDSSGTGTGGTTSGPGTSTDPSTETSGASSSSDSGTSAVTTNSSAFGGCTGVDILFVIDNSVSMGDYQTALGLAFPEFADAVVTVLPPGTNVHVGVTSSEMGKSSSGSTSNCGATGDAGQPMDAFYITPDVMNTGVNGAQGRLYDSGSGPFHSVDTDGSPAELQGLKDWFTQAVAIGEGGSNIEMAAAPAGWAFDPANAATNAGFVRDEGAVLVLFFMQDEPDQTPPMIDTQTGGQAMLAKLALAKTECGGTSCIVGGGFVHQSCTSMVPLGELLDGLGAPPVTAELPPNPAVDPAAAAATMATLLRDTLAAAIAEKCTEIPPPA